MKILIIEDEKPAVELNPGVREKIVVGQEKAAPFKKWLDR